MNTISPHLTSCPWFELLEDLLFLSESCFQTPCPSHILYELVQPYRSWPSSLSKICALVAMNGSTIFYTTISWDIGILFVIRSIKQPLETQNPGLCLLHSLVHQPSTDLQ